MANEVTLKAHPRGEIGRIANRKLKTAGSVPAVLYGHGDPEHLGISAHELGLVLNHAVGEHFLVSLEVEGDRNPRHAIVQDVQHHPVSRAVLHVDFLRVLMGEALTSTVPIEPFGDCFGVKTQGGILEQNLHELEIECLPKDLPDLIKVDVSSLRVGDAIHVSDLKLPAGVTALDDAEQPVFAVAEPNVVEEEPVADAPGAPEVLKEKPAAEEKKA